MSNSEKIQYFIQHGTDVLRELKYMAEEPFDTAASHHLNVINGSFSQKIPFAQFYSFFAAADCSLMAKTWHSSLASLVFFLNFWQKNFSSANELNHIFFIDRNSLCLADFGMNSRADKHEKTMKLLINHIDNHLSNKNTDRKNSIYWIAPATQSGFSYFYVLTPIYSAAKSETLLGIEQNIRLDDSIIINNFPVIITLIDKNNRFLLSSGQDDLHFSLNELPNARTWFGYADNYKQLVLKKSLFSSTLSVVYSISTNAIVSQLKSPILYVLLLNLLSGITLFFLSWFFERRIFLPAKNNAHSLEEHEQFNRKIVAAAPVGICILSINHGATIFSNELAQNYLSLLTLEDRRRLTEIICGQQVNVVDLLTGSHTNLQISFVHSHYQNEKVAICVLVDVSSRVKMEESLQEIASAAEQASQSKSMFLATISHELRTPLYGIIGNLDLLQTKSLPKEIVSLVTTMHSSSNLLLKIISDILDFSKIESEQLRIEPREFSPRQVILHTISNTHSLVIKKRLTLFCLIDNPVPLSLKSDPLRLQQVISNLLNNAIKFTHTGCIIFHAYVKEGYLALSIRDTGVGISAKVLTRLFDPFFQVGTGVQRNFQGTGLGLAISEKLINMMDGDIEVKSEPGMGSQFIIRIPLYNNQKVPMSLQQGLQQRRVWLALCNDFFSDFLQQLLREYGMQVGHYDKKFCEHEDVIITDYDFSASYHVRAIIEFNSRHITKPKEISNGRWVCSTVVPHELPTLLGHIYGLPINTAENSMPLSAEKMQTDNQDIQVLVVDDHPVNRMLLSAQLGSLGFRVKTAQDGVDALKVIKLNKMDIVLSDVNMPNMDGYSLTQCLRQQGETFPVIGVTANALADEKQRCMEAGMDDCLSKPITLDTLRKTLLFYVVKVRKKKADKIKISSTKISNSDATQ